MVGALQAEGCLLKPSRGELAMSFWWGLGWGKSKRNFYVRLGRAQNGLKHPWVFPVGIVLVGILLGLAGVIGNGVRLSFGQVSPRIPGEGQHPRQPPGLPRPEGMGPIGPDPHGLHPVQMEASGVVNSLAPRGLQIVSSDGRAWILMVRPDAKVELLGTAEPSFLRPGQLVRFIAQVDRKRGLVDEPVGSLLIFTPNFSKIETQLGVFPAEPAPGAEDLPGGVGHQGALPQPAVSSAPNPSRRAHPKDSPRGDTASPRSLPEKIRLDIRGRLSGISKQGKLLVVLPPNAFLRGTLEVPLAENADIRVDWSEAGAFMMAAPGDRVRAKGVQVGPNAIEVSELTIEKMTPLGENPSAGRRSTRQDSPSNREENKISRPPSRTVPDRPDRNGKQALPWEGKTSPGVSKDQSEEAQEAETAGGEDAGKTSEPE